ncbi:SDR family NAD(P)-dependent oxidoreductase [Clostridium oryzae]|uniref:C-factor n=1 Tax=Clostridium oryzae TaxID=1450648 RepID=A0A1V4IDS0_9CLOT|nr:SDR family NAD(P)-dependent oxidoreductase [Clostridium oryzae]OPJ57795.1 C-factor [Clostridium oryzae]
MNKVAVVTGADRGVGFSICKQLLEQGWMVFAGQFMPEWLDLHKLETKYPDMLKLVSLDVGSLESVKKAAQEAAKYADHVDMLVSNAGIFTVEGNIEKGLDYSVTNNLFNVNALGGIRMVECFLPLMEVGMKRLCFISSEAGSIQASERKDTYGYCMSKAALNMAVKIMFNDLHPRGYTFRLYHPGWVRSYMSGKKATEGELEPEETASSAIKLFTKNDHDEERLVMIDNRGNEWPF